MNNAKQQLTDPIGRENRITKQPRINAYSRRRLSVQAPTEGGIYGATVLEIVQDFMYADTRPGGADPSV